MRLPKALMWAALAALFSMPFLGFRINPMMYAFPAAALAVALAMAEFEERHSDPRRIALVGVIVALAVASRQLLHGIEFSPVFFIVILAGRAFGFTTGFAAGALTMFASNFFIGHGPWTPFQMLGLGLTGALAALLPAGGRLENRMLTAYSVASAYLYGAVTDSFSWLAFVPVHTPQTFAAVVASGMVANTARAAGNAFFMALLGPALLRVLLRFRKRLTTRADIDNHGKGRSHVGCPGAVPHTEEDGREKRGQVFGGPAQVGGDGGRHIRGGRPRGGGGRRILRRP
jgi:energy-coupling factor transport system substrate-specific component